MPITVVLLAAGYATRLYPLTKDTPKALLPLGRGVILDEVIRTLDEIPGVAAQLLVTNSRFAEPFRQWQQRSRRPIRVIDDGTTSAETRLGAIRDLALAHRMAEPGDDLLVLGTDNVFRWSLAAFIARAQRHRPHPAIALWQAPSRESATQFGVVVRDGTQRITDFIEKSPQPPSRDVALCVYYFPSAMLGTIEEFLAQGGNADAPGYFIQWLVGRDPVYGVMMPGDWYDIGTLESYHTVIRAWDGS